MLVFVTRLRIKGKKLSHAEAQFTMPIRSYLTLQPSQTLRTHEEYLSAWLNQEMDAMSKSVLPPMERAWVKRATNFQMVVIGTERIDRGTKNCDWYPQAWWCRFPER